jgi:hypothetical protein
LRIGIDCNELNTALTFFDHAIYGIATRATDADNFDYR